MKILKYAASPRQAAEPPHLRRCPHAHTHTHTHARTHTHAPRLRARPPAGLSNAGGGRRPPPQTRRAKARRAPLFIENWQRRGSVEKPPKKGGNGRQRQHGWPGPTGRTGSRAGPGRGPDRVTGRTGSRAGPGHGRRHDRQRMVTHMSPYADATVNIR